VVSETYGDVRVMEWASNATSVIPTNSALPQLRGMRQERKGGSIEMLSLEGLEKEHNCRRGHHEAGLQHRKVPFNTLQSR